MDSALDDTDYDSAITNQSTSQSAEEDRHIEPEYGNKQEKDDGDDGDDDDDDDGDDDDGNDHIDNE